MPDKCETCDGRGVIVSTPNQPKDATGGPFVRVWKCAFCNRITGSDDLRAHVLRCCEAHDELVAACNMCERAMIEVAEAVPIATSTDWINLRAARNLARAAVAKAQPVKESTTA